MTNNVTMTTEEILQYINNGVLTVRIQPEMAMTDWKIYRVSFSRGNDSYHAVGWCDGSYRVCSPIRKFYPNERKFITRSGREYYLIGLPYDLSVEDDIDGVKGASMSAAFDFWCKTNGATKIKGANQTFLDAVREEATEPGFMLDISPDGEIIRHAA